MTHTTTPSRPARRSPGLLAAAATLPLLVVGGAGVGAVTTLTTTVERNTSTVHGTDFEQLPVPEIAVSGSPFAITLTPEGAVTGSTASPFVITNENDVPGIWDAVLTTTEDSNPRVAAATAITAAVAVRAPNNRTYSIDLDLGTLAEPVSVIDAFAEWQKGDVWTLPDMPGTSIVRGALVMQGTQLGIGQSVTITVTPTYDETVVSTIADALAAGQVAVATASFRVTSMAA